MVGGFVEDAQHDVESVLAGEQAQMRLVVILGRQRLELGARDIGRVGDDHVVTLIAERGEQIGLEHLHPVADAVALDVVTGDDQRLGRDVDQIDIGVRQIDRRRDADAAAAGAQIQHPADAIGVDPGIEPDLDQLGDRRARHQHLFIDPELQSREPGAPDQIGRRHALDDPAFDEFADAHPLGRGEPAVAEVRGQIGVEVQGAQHQQRRLVDGVVGAVPEVEAGRVEAARAPAHEVLNRDQTVWLLCHGAHTSSS